MATAPSDPGTEVPRALAARFRISRVLGAGGMGVVFLGEMPGTGKPCAVKIVKVSGNDRHRRRLEREARMLSRVRHPNLVEVYDLGVEPEGPWLAMERVEGRSLAELCKQEGAAGPDPEWLADVVRDTAAALEALHREGVVHRDVKPGNIMVDRRGRTVLMDLGLATDEDASRLTQTGHLVGTVPFIAPEVFRGEPPAPAADWYALGVSVFRCMEGRYPFSQEQVFEMVGRQDWAPMPSPSERWRSHRLAEAAARLMDRDPAARPARARDLERILGAGTRSGALRAPSGPPPGGGEDRQDLPTASIVPPTRPGTPGARGGSALLGAGLASLLGALVFFGRAPPRAPDPSSGGAGGGVAAAPLVLPGRAVEALARGPEVLIAWARAREDEARRRERAADRPGANRARRGALAALRLLPGRAPALVHLKLELLLGLADPGGPAGVHTAWLERAHRLLAEVGPPGPGVDPEAEAIERIRGRLEVLGRRSPSSALGDDPFPPVAPRGALLWALRTYPIERIPADAMEGLLTLGLGQGPDFRPRDWAGDLGEHPVVLLAEARRASGWAKTLPDPLVAALERTRSWRPAPGAGEAAWKLWFEHQYLCLVQAAHRASPGPALDALLARSERVRATLGADGVGAALRDLAEAWTGLFEGSVGNGLGRRRARPLVRAGLAVDRLLTRLDGPPSPEPVAGYRTLLRLEAGYLGVMVRHLLLHCEAAEVAVARLRGLTDWDAVQRAGLGGLFVAVSSLDYGDLSPEIELCRATRLAYGTPLEMVRFLDGEPPAGP